MDFYVKNEAGELVKATQEDILSADSIKYDKDGNALNKRADTPDPIAELTGVVKELATTVSGSNDATKDKLAEIEEKMAAYKETAGRGIVIPTGDANLTADDKKEIWAPYDLATQGHRLTEKLFHPKHTITEDRRVEMAKYFCLFMKAAYFQDRKAQEDFTKTYGRQKTAIGDSGNVFIVPDIVDSEILAFAREKSTILQNARVWEMVSDKQSFPQETGSSSVAWGNTTGSSDPTVSEVELDAYELSAYTTVVNTTLADTRSDIVSWLTEMMAEAAGQELDNVAWNGDGTSTYAGCSGILTAACGYSVVMGSGSTTFGSIDADVLSEMISKLDGIKKEGAMFHMNGVSLHNIRSLKDTTDRPIFIETVGAPMSGTIWGYPYKEVIKITGTTAANTAFCSFGNLKYFALGRRLDATQLQVDPWGLWTTNRTRFKIYQRWALQMGLPKGFVRLITAAS